MAASYYFAKRYSEVVDATVRIGRLNITDHRSLAASYTQFGRLDKVRMHVKEVLEIDPQFTLSKFRANSQRLYNNETEIEHYIDGLRKAGLPE